MSSLALRRDDARLAIAALVFGAIVIGTTPILVRLADCGAAAAGFWRLAIAAPLLALMASSRGTAGVGRPSWAIGLAGIAFALDLGCWHYGIRYTSVANATVLPNLTPILVTLVSWAFLKEQPRPVFLVGLVAAVGGAVLMTYGPTSARAAGAMPHIGDALSISTAVWYGLYFIAVRAARRRSSTFSVMLWSCIVGAPPLLLTAFLMREQLLPASALGWGAVAGLGLAHVFGQGSIAWALGRLPASTASVTVLVQPVIAGMLAYLIFREVLTSLQIAGGALALMGVVVAQQAPAKVVA
jgi:drug/metabolite transporter (DMT)-like permease